MDHSYLQLPVQFTQEGRVVGYRAKIKPNSNHYMDVSIYSEIKEDAIST
jgi:hypothetical protein